MYLVSPEVPPVCVSCGYELSFRYESQLCGEPAVIIIDRREYGRLPICPEHMTQDLYEQVDRMRWQWYGLDLMLSSEND